MTLIGPSAPADLQIHQRVTKHREGHVPPLLLLQETILASSWGKGRGQIVHLKAQNLITGT